MVYNNETPMRIHGLLMAAALAAGSVCVRAQWLNHPTAKAPRTKDGKVNLKGPVPRLNGKPDLSGIWQAEPAPSSEWPPDSLNGAQALGESAPSRYFVNVLADYKPGEIVMTPAAEAMFKQRGASFGKDIPSTHCLPLGVPFMDTAVYPHKIVHTAGMILVLYEEMSHFRQIYLDGRKLPVDPEPAYVGYSVGRWEGDTLVVDAIGFKDNGWLDAFGHPHSGAMKVTERFRRRDYGSMEVQVTVDDPRTYSRPFSFTFIKRLLPDTDLLETFCE